MDSHEYQQGSKRFNALKKKAATLLRRISDEIRPLYTGVFFLLNMIAMISFDQAISQNKTKVAPDNGWVWEEDVGCVNISVAFN